MSDHGNSPLLPAIPRTSDWSRLIAIAAQGVEHGIAFGSRGPESKLLLWPEEMNIGSKSRWLDHVRIGDASV